VLILRIETGPLPKDGGDGGHRASNISFAHYNKFNQSYASGHSARKATGSIVKKHRIKEGSK
jgi:hypothetical protein